jgi:hypothetical protein
MRNEGEERDRAQAQTLRRETLEQKNDTGGCNLPVDRRSMLKRAGMVLGASGTLAALAIPSGATSQDPDGDAITGLWQGVVSAQDNSFPPFNTFELYGGTIWISSGQTDLTPAALSSSLWAIFKRVGPRTFRGIGRFWTYDSSANPTGFGTVDQTTKVSEDGRTYYGEGPLQFFDNSGNPLGPPTTIIDKGKRIDFS